MTDGEKRAVLQCEQCKSQRAGIPHGSYTNASPGGTYWAVEYTLMECVVCHSPFVVESSSPALDEFGYWSDDHWTLPEQVLPPIDDAMDDSVPSAITKSYHEAKRCLRGGNYTAAALMCRRTMELICKYYNANGNSLWAMLNDLKAKLVLDERMYDWANQVLRRLGNEGAHDADEELEAEDAADAVDFTRAIIWSLLVLPAALSRHMDRRPPKGANAPRANRPAKPSKFQQATNVRASKHLAQPVEQPPSPPPSELPPPTPQSSLTAGDGSAQ